MNPHLFETIAKIYENIDEEIPDVNRGGCAVVASMLGERLQKIGVKNVDCRVYNYEWNMSEITAPDLNTLEHNIREEYGDAYVAGIWNENGVHFVHVKMHVDGFLWDSEGAVSLDEPETENWRDGCYVLVNGFISIETMKSLADNKHNWNPAFSRDNIPQIAEIMDKHLNEYLGSSFRLAA